MIQPFKLSSPILFSANDPKTTFDELLKKKKSGIQRLERNQPRLIENLEKLKGHTVETNLPKLSVISGRYCSPMFFYDAFTASKSKASSSLFCSK